MDLELTDDQVIIRKAVAALAARFDDDYWLARDSAHEFPGEAAGPRGTGGDGTDESARPAASNPAAADCML